MEAALDGDSDRKTILGQNAFFVMPYDSLVVLANNLEHLPWFKANGQEGQGRRGEVYVHQRVNVKRANWSKKLGDTGLRQGGQGGGTNQAITPTASPSPQAQMRSLRRMKLSRNMLGPSRHPQEQSTESLDS